MARAVDEPVLEGRHAGARIRAPAGLATFAHGRIFIGTCEAVVKRPGEAPAAPAIAGYALSCADPGGFVQRCRKAGLRVVRGRNVLLPPALGGVWTLRKR
jgi:hypothetical protein